MSDLSVVKCTRCQVEYDPADPEAQERHTVRIESEACCGKCFGKPSCYVCYGHRCVCFPH